MKHSRRISLILAVFGAVVLLSGFLPAPLPDWAVRTAGVVTLASLFVLAFTTARLACGKKTEAQHEDRT